MAQKSRSSSSTLSIVVLMISIIVLLGRSIAKTTPFSSTMEAKALFNSGWWGNMSSVYHCELEGVKCDEAGSVNEIHMSNSPVLKGATIAAKQVYISHYGTHVDDSDPWSNPSWQPGYGHSSSDGGMTQFVSTPGEAVTLAQEAVKTMIAKGYVLSKDTLNRTKALDESYQVSSTATAKVAEFSNKISLTDKIYTGVEAVIYVDRRHHISETTRTAALYTGKTAVAAADAMVISSYFSKGALWVSDALNHAAKVAADLGTHGINK